MATFGGKPALRAATYNIHGCVGAGRRRDPERVYAVIRELDADVVALQEVHFAGTAEALAERLQPSFPWTAYKSISGPTLLRSHGPYGNALLTRLPIEAVRRVDITVGRREPRGMLDVRLRKGNVPIRVMATHLGLRPWERRRQVRRLVREWVRGDRGTPSLLLGDLNEVFPRGRNLRLLYRVLERTPAPRTFPARWPLLALDRILVRPLESLRGLWVHRSPLARQASDHLPLLGLIVLPVSVPNARAEPSS